MVSFELIDTLCTIPGPTGQEERVISWLQEQWGPKTKSLRVGAVGNLYAEIGGVGPHLVIQAHADEIGFVVRSIDEHGFLHLATAQVSDPASKRYPVGQPALVLAHGKDIRGIFAAPSGHVQTKEQWEKERFDYSDFFVDIGATSYEEAAALGVHPGSRVIWNPTTQRLGTRICGKALDDRFALALMTELLDRVEVDQLAYRVTLAVTVQEENGLIGAQAMTRELEADQVLALEVGLSGDVPNVEPRTMPTKLGGGPVLVHKDATVHYNRDLIWKIAEVAANHNIPVQHAMFENYGSDGAQFIRNGIPTALIAPPTRYTHSAFEMMDEADLDRTTDLLAHFIATPSS
jgi:tetrahedral aminopeptidase